MLHLMDSQSYIFVHAYVVGDWRRQPILLNLEIVMEEGTLLLLLFVLLLIWVVSMVDIANKVVCFGVDGVTIFQGLKTSVIVQFMNMHNHFIIGIHCMTHQCNLVVQTFSSLFLVAKIEALLFSMYIYYSQSFKRHLECTELAKVIDYKGLIF